MPTKRLKPPRLDETPDFDALLAGIEKAVAAAAKSGEWMTIAGIRVFDDVVRNETETSSQVVLGRVHRRLAALIRKTIRQEASDVRPQDVFQPLGDVFFMVFPRTPAEKVNAPLRRIFDAWRLALVEAVGYEKITIQRTYHVGLVSWSPALRETSAKELLGFATFMVDEAGRRPIDPSLHDALRLPKTGRESVHVASFHWL
ncbi:MAG: hypothetical protein FJZ01_09775 [Candidatus Sericytochromatia bacterium]|nr:hypothetical protein [Candidatus Tanganyikabacteria bacterium]